MWRGGHGHMGRERIPQHPPCRGALNVLLSAFIRPCLCRWFPPPLAGVPTEHVMIVLALPLCRCPRLSINITSAISFSSIALSFFILNLLLCKSNGMDLELGLLQHRKFPEKRSLDFSETELTLGLPGLKNCGERESKAEKEQESVAAGEGGLRRKRSRSQMTQQQQQESSSSSSSTLLSPSPPPMESPPPCKARAVGWPPVREFRRARTSSYSLKTEEEDEELKGIVGGLFVKVSMDGAPYLRKLDLHLHKSYQDLTIALQRMFCCTVTIHNQDDHHHLSLQQTFSNPSSFVATYQDRDGDWMLVGDVPWEMFTHSCKRLRIVKASEAIGLAPQSQESHKGQMTSNGMRHMGCGL